LAAVYLHENKPAVHFASDPGGDALLHLRRQLWNYNQGALLVGVDTHTARFLDGFRQPALDDAAGL